MISTFTKPFQQIPSPLSYLKLLILKNKFDCKMKYLSLFHIFLGTEKCFLSVRLNINYLF